MFYLRMLLVSTLAAGIAATAYAASEPPLPNILLLVAEDLSPRVGAWADGTAQTPNLDKLAAQSVRYTSTFTAAGVCAPSRAALIMGVHQISFGAQHMRASTGPLGEYYAQPDEVMKAFPELLRRAGYFTFTDSKLDYQFSGIRAGSGPFTIWDSEGPQASWDDRDPGQPFFGLINFLETHESGIMRLDSPPHSQSHAATQQMRKAAGLVAEPVTDPADIVVPAYYPDIPEVREDLARHYDNIHAMDKKVGRILARLEAQGLRDQTIVIWTTDHGDGLPRAKREVLDSGIHVPMLVDIPTAYQPDSWRQGQDDDRLVSFVDLAPTILAWAEVEPPPGIHGQNFLHSNRQYIYASRDRIDEVEDRQRAVRDHRFKYIRSWSPEVPGGHVLAYRDNLEMVRAMRALWQAGELNASQARWFEPVAAEQLYELTNDPNELNNLINDETLVVEADRMRDALTAWLDAVGDTSEIAESDLRDSFLAGGEVPVTPSPVVKRKATRLSAQATNGASIGYRVGDGRWRLYTGPIEVPDQPVSFKAVRYGWRESSPVIFTSDSN